MDLNSFIELERDKTSLILHNERSYPSFLPLHLSGGMGDVVMSIDAVAKLSEKFRLVIYTGYPEIYSRFAGIQVFKEMPDYSWHLEFNSVALFKFHEGFHGFLIKDHENLYLQQQALFKKLPYFYELIKQHPHKDYLLCRYAVEQGLDRRTLPLYSLGFTQ